MVEVLVLRQVILVDLVEVVVVEMQVRLLPLAYRLLEEVVVDKELEKVQVVLEELLFVTLHNI